MRTLMRRTLSFPALAVVAALLVAGCGSGSSSGESSGSAGSGGSSSTSVSASSSGSAESSGSEAGGGSSATQGATIGFATPQGTDPGLQLLDKGMITEAEKLGMTVKTADANLEVNKQLSDLETFIQEKVSAIVVWPLDSHAVEPALQQAAAAKIPVVAIYDLAGGPYYTDLIIDGVGVGRSAAEYLAKTLGKGAKVAAIFGPPQVDQFRQMAEGFKQGATASGLDLVESQVDPQISSETTAPLVANFKTRFGSQLKGLFTSTDTQAQGAYSTFGGGFDPKIVTYASLQGTLDLVKEGKYGAGVYQNTVLIGRISAWAVGQALEGAKIQSKLYLEPPVIEKQAAESFPTPQEQLTKAYEFKPVQEGGRWYMPLFK